jgi:hypothetical protein
LRGTIALTLTKKGAFSGKLRFAGRVLPVRGSFGTFGDYFGAIDAGGEIGTLFLNFQYLRESKAIDVRIGRELDGFVESLGLAERSTWSTS